MNKVYSGADRGPGAVYEWEGNSKAGKGRMEILAADAARTDIKLDFIKPFPGDMLCVFALVPQSGGTRVTWTMSGPQKFFPSKIMSVFVTMDRMIGGDFERGLGKLKTVAER